MKEKKKNITNKNLEESNILQEPTAVYQKASSIAMEGVYLNIPKADLKLIKELARKMGWTIETKESLLQKYIDSRPSNVDLTDDDILEELNCIRYKK